MEKHSSSLNTNGSSKVKFLCSYGGKIQSRPTNHHQLSYIGGDTKILSVSGRVSLPGIISKLNSLFNMKESPDLSIKYQLPGEDLDALVSLIDDEDVEHMMVEYDRMHRISAKPARLRLFIFDISAPLVKSGGGVKGDSDPITPSNSYPDYLFGFDKEYQPNIGPSLDLLQIRPGLVLPENYGLIPYGGVEGKIGITDGVNNSSANGAAAAQVVFGVPPAVVQGGGTVYNFVPVLPSMPQRRMMVSTANCEEAEGKKWKF